MTIPNASDSWRNLRSLYPLYGALAREFVIEMQSCRELEQEDVPSAESVAAGEKWVAEMDQRIQIHQLRQFLQTSAQADEEALRELLVHHLNKAQRTDHDRDKVDFLLVQLFSQRAPSNVADSDLGLTEVAKLLEPVLGTVEISTPEFLTGLDELLANANRAKDLKALFTSRIIERGREIKISCGEKFFEPVAMVAFARFGFLVRRAFFRLMHQDLNAILDGLRELESRGVTTLDCRKAQFAADEPIARLRMICQSWKVMFHAEYSSGQPLCILVDLRTAVEAALLHNARLGGSQKASAAGAGVGPFSIASTDAPEFEVSGGSATWDAEAVRDSGTASGK